MSLHSSDRSGIPQTGLMLFKGHTAEEALAKVHQSLGSSAIVVQLKRVPSAGIGRIWGAMEIEAWAQAPAPIIPTPITSDSPVARVRSAPKEARTMELLRSLGLNEDSARKVHQSIPSSGAALTNQEACLQLGAALLAAWDKGTKRIPKHPAGLPSSGRRAPAKASPQPSGSPSNHSAIGTIAGFGASMELSLIQQSFYHSMPNCSGSPWKPPGTRACRRAPANF